MQPEPYYAPAQTALAAKGIYVTGPSGNDDPQRAVASLIVNNIGTVPLRAGASLTGIFTQGRYQPVVEETAVPFEGEHDAFILYNPDAATAASFGEQGVKTAQRNSGQDAGYTFTPGSTQYQVAKLNVTAGSANVSTTVPTRFKRTVTGFNLYCPATITGGTITLAIQDSDGNALLSAATFDLETLVAATLTALTVTTSSHLLVMPVGRSIVAKVSSSNVGDTIGQIHLEIVYTVG